MKKIFNALLLFVCFSCLPAFGQVTFTALDADVCDVNGTATVDFTINTTETLGAFQFAVIWDTNILENAVLEDVALGSSYNEDEIDNGEIRVGWFNAGANGDFDPNEVIFRITFDHVSGSANSSLVDITALASYPILVADDNFGPFADSDIIINDGTVTYGDAISPVINNCPTNITQTIPFGQVTDVVNWADVMPTDNCTTPTLNESHSSGDAFPIGTTDVSITAADMAGNVSIACEFTVTISEEIDDTPFTINISEEETGCQDLTVSFDFTTVNFTNMTSMAYGVTWDANLLEFIDATDVFSGVNNFNDNNAAAGELRVGWFDGNSFSLDDNDLLYTLNFNFLGNVGDVATLEIISLPTYPIIISDENGQLNPSQYELNSNTVTHINNAAPVINDCPTAMTVDNDMGECSAVVTFTLPTITEDCDTNIELTQTSILGNGDTFPIGESTVSYEATDNIGQTANCTFTITVNDMEDPIFSNCPTNMEVSAAAGTCEAVANWTIPTALDNCESEGATTLVASHTSGSTFTVGQNIIVTYTATDVAGNDATCFFTIDIIDDESPIISGCLENISQSADADVCSTIVTWQAPTATDNCGNVDLTTTHNPDSVFPLGTTNVTYTATDDTGNESLCNFSVTITDDTAPVISCPDNITMMAENGCTAVVTWQEPTPVDNCTIAAFTPSHNSGDEFSTGVTTVNYMTLDANGNEASCSFTITIEGQNNITMGACPPNQTVTVASEECTASVTWTPPIATNTCNGEPTLSSNYNPLDDFSVGSTVVTYEAVNDNGNTAMCSFTVTVTVTETGDGMTTFSGCPMDILAASDDDTCGTSVSWTEPTVTNSCEGGTITVNGSHNPGDFFAVGTTTVTYTTTDGDGNPLSCSFDVIVSDAVAPVLSCPENINMILPTGQMEAIVTWETATVIDNCTMDLIPSSDFTSGNTYVLGMYTVTYSAIDEAENIGTCTFEINIQEEGNTGGNACNDDTEAPMITNCPTDMDLTTDPGTCTTTVTWTEPTITDNCDFTFVVSHENGATYDSGIYPVTYNAIDAAGNTATCAFSFKIHDDENPVIFGLPNADIVVANTPGQCGAIVTWDAPSYFDNCEIMSINCTRNPGEFFDIGQVTVSCTVFDLAGNSTTESFSVTVIDDEAPEFQCVEDIVVNADGTVVSDPDNILTDLTNTACNMVEINFDLPVATDACSIALTEQTAGVQESGDVFAVGSYSLEYTATDLVGNSTSCSLNITVQEEVEPAIAPTFMGGLCEGGSGKLCVSGIENATYAWFDPVGNNVSNAQCVDLDNVEMSDAGEYMVNIITGTGCVYSSIYEFVVYETAALEVSVEPVLCATGDENLEFFATDLANTNVTDWSWMGVSNLSSSIQNLVVANVDESNSGIYNLTATNTNGCVSQISVEATVTTAPEAAQIITSNQLICTGESTVLTGTNYGTDNVTYIWTAQPAAGAGLPSNTNSFQIEVAPTSGANITYFMFATVDGCPAEQGSITIVQEGPPTIEIIATGNTTCVDGTSSLVLSEMGGQATEWNWTGPNGFTAQGQEITIDNLTAENAGSYTVTAATNLGCDNTMSYQVELTEQPTGLIAEFLDSELCEGENAMLNIAGFTGNGVTYEFTGTNAPATTALTNVNFGAYEAGMYDFSVVAAVDGCVSEPVDIAFEVQAAPNSAIVQTGEEDCVEAGSQITLASTIPLANYEWAFNGQVISTNSFVVLDDVSPEDSGLYQLEISSSFGCTSTISEMLSISEAVNPVEIDFSNTGCVGEVLQLQAVDENFGLSYRWTLNGEVFSTEQNPTIDFLSEINEGDYTVSATNPQTGCSSISAVESLTLLSAPAAEQDFGLIFLPTANIELTLTDNDNIPEGTDYTISIFQQPEFGRIEILDATKGKVNYIRETETARTDRFFYEVCYDDCDEACARAMVTINIKYSTDECVMTNLISPNGDGTNDEFMIYCLEDGDFKDNVLTIYNQWGDKVYSAAPYENDWTGTFEGEDLPDGTYFYTFRRDAQSEVKKGHLTIFR
jgi:gliding motility-associated-like protein